MGPGGGGSGTVLAMVSGVPSPAGPVPAPCVPGRVCAPAPGSGVGPASPRGHLDTTEGKRTWALSVAREQSPSQGPGHLRQPSIVPSAGRRAKSPRATRGHRQSLCHHLPGQAPAPSRTKTVCASATGTGSSLGPQSRPCPPSSPQLGSQVQWLPGPHPLSPTRALAWVLSPGRLPPGPSCGSATAASCWPQRVTCTCRVLVSDALAPGLSDGSALSDKAVKPSATRRACTGRFGDSEEPATSGRHTNSWAGRRGTRVRGPDP